MTEPSCKCVQSADGGVQVPLVSALPVEELAEEGEKLGVAGLLLPTGSTPTLQLPNWPETQTSVLLCSQSSYGRRLKFLGERCQAPVCRQPIDIEREFQYDNTVYIENADGSEHHES